MKSVEHNVSSEEITKATEMVRAIVQGEMDKLMAENKRLVSREDSLQGAWRLAQERAVRVVELEAQVRRLEEQLEALRKFVSSLERTSLNRQESDDWRGGWVSASWLEDCCRHALASVDTLNGIEQIQSEGLDKGGQAVEDCVPASSKGNDLGVSPSPSKASYPATEASERGTPAGSDGTDSGTPDDGSAERLSRPATPRSEASDSASGSALPTSVERGDALSAKDSPPTTDSRNQSGRTGSPDICPECGHDAHTPRYCVIHDCACGEPDPACSPHEWIRPVGAGVYRCTKCGLETATLPVRPPYVLSREQTREE